MKEIENLIQQINDALEPISKEIEQNLKSLEKYTGVEETYTYDPITMEDIKKAE